MKPRKSLGVTAFKGTPSEEEEDDRSAVVSGEDLETSSDGEVDGEVDGDEDCDDDEFDEQCLVQQRSRKSLSWRRDAWSKDDEGALSK